MGAGRRLQRNAGEPADLAEPSLQLVHESKIALDHRRILQGMGSRKADEPRRIFVYLRVVFHGAGTERVKPAVDAEISLRQAQKVSHHLMFREFRQAVVLADQVLRQNRLRHI